RAISPTPRPTPFPYTTLFRSSLPCPDIAGLTGRAADPLRNAVAFGPSSTTLDALTSLGGEPFCFGQIVPFEAVIGLSGSPGPERDRKSTRLNSSHDQISYAVF